MMRLRWHAACFQAALVAQAVHAAGFDLAGLVCVQVCHADLSTNSAAEPQGMRRVLAAIEAHMWSGLHLKPAPSERGGGGRGASLSSTEALGHDGISGNSVGLLPEVPAPGDAAAGAAGCSGNMASGANMPTAGPGRGAGAHEAFGSSMGIGDNDAMGDKADRGFAQLMGQMSGSPCFTALQCSECALAAVTADLLRPALQMSDIWSPSAGTCWLNRVRAQEAAYTWR